MTDSLKGLLSLTLQDYERKRIIKIKINDSNNSKLSKKKNENIPNDKQKKLREAYKSGLLTEDEYKRKISEWNQIRNVNSTEQNFKKSAKEEFNSEK